MYQINVQTGMLQYVQGGSQPSAAVTAGYFSNDGQTMQFIPVQGTPQQVTAIKIVDTGVDEPDYGGKPE